MTTSSDRARAAAVQGFFDLYPDEAAKILETTPAHETVRLLQAEPAARAVAVIQRLTSQTATDVIEGMAEDRVGEVVSAMDASKAAALLARLEASTQARILNLLESGIARELQELMSYPPDSAGGLMDPRVTSFRSDATAAQVLTRLRDLRHRRILEISLVDTEGHLVGRLPLQEVALASPDERLDTLVRGAPPSVKATATREEVVEELTQRRLTSLAVVDFEGRLLGVIRYDALVQAVQEEASLDIQTMVGVSKEERALSNVSFAVRRRLPWLQINLLTAFLAASVVGLFEDTIARFTALAVLLPVVAGQSGNTGAQALAVTMRGLAVREIRVRQWPRVSLKEVNVAAINGCAVAVTTSLAVYLWSGSFGLALVIGLSMVISMAAAGLSGAATPLVLTALGQDPAQSSSIILTTITDVVGFFSFLGIATLLAGML